MTPDGWAAYLRWRPEFARAIDESLYPLAWLDGRVAQGSAHLIAVADAAIIYEYRPYPSGAFQVEGLVAAGNATTIVDTLIPYAEREAMQAGAVAAQIESRPGWARLLRQRGYRSHQTTIRKVFGRG